MISIERYRIAIGSWSDYQEAARREPPPYRVIVNVSDRTPLLGAGSLHHYWYPINELGPWGYSPFFWAKRILDFHNQRNDSILVHCTAGAHRSPMIVFTWLLSLQLPSGPPDFHAIDELLGGDFADLYFSDIRRGTIPEDLHRLYELMLDSRTGLTDCLERMNRHRAH